MRTRFIVLLIAAGLAILFTACSGSAPTPTPMPAMGLKRKGLSPSEVEIPWSQPDSGARLKVLSCRGFRHMGETIHLLGEIENTSDTKMGNISVKIVGYTKEGKAMDTKEDQAYLDPVLPGERTAFRVFFDARDVARAELAVTGEPTDTEPTPALEVSDVTLSEPSSGYSHIKGELNNPGSDSVKVTLIAILRDKDGEAVEVHRAKLVKPVPAGTSSFDVLVLDHGAETVDVLALVRGAQ
jgi:hypothetical protein